MQQQPLRTRDVVACVVTDGEKVCLVQRSARVAHDRGRWHCITGYLEPGENPTAAARAELREELGLSTAALEDLVTGPVLDYVEAGTQWRVHTFLARVSRMRFQLNWENDAYVWASPTHSMAGCVSWLADVYAGVLSPQTTASFASGL